MRPTFDGFSPDLLAYLEDLSRNNNREWFQENKTRYRETVQIPMSNFIMAFAPSLDKISSHYIADPRLHGGSMFRIYRDTRFAKGKPPYKTNIGCQLRHEAGKDAHAPGFYFHIEPGEIFIGGGIYKPDSAALFKVRTAISEKPEQWQKIIKQKRFKDRFTEVYGESLKRPPRGFDPEHPHLEHLKKKTLFVTEALSPADLYSPKLVEKVKKTFEAASPFMQFLTEALELPYSN